MSKDRDRDRDRNRDRGKPTCGGCKNFKPGSGPHGVCQRTAKKRDVGEKACGHYDPL